MFKTVFSSPCKQVTIYLEGMPLPVPEGSTVAAAVLHAGMADARTTAIKHEQRGPFCLMGVCHECLMEIDGIPNQQACLVPVREGMRVKRQDGPPSFRPVEHQ